MFGLIAAIIIFNYIAFTKCKKLTKNQIIHIWVFTIALQNIVDIYIDIKYQGYWYFTKAVDWESLFAVTVLIPPVNMMFLNWFPFDKPLTRKILYFVAWLSLILAYELITLLPEPLGYFYYGWWNLGFSAVADIILLLILLEYFNWIKKVERFVK